MQLSFPFCTVGTVQQKNTIQNNPRFSNGHFLQSNILLFGAKKQESKDSFQQTQPTRSSDRHSPHQTQPKFKINKSSSERAKYYLGFISEEDKKTSAVKRAIEKMCAEEIVREAKCREVYQRYFDQYLARFNDSPIQSFSDFNFNSQSHQALLKQVRKVATREEKDALDAEIDSIEDRYLLYTKTLASGVDEHVLTCLTGAIQASNSYY